MYLIGYLKTEFCHETALSLVMISICQWQFSYIIYYQDRCIDIKWCIHWNILQPLKCGKFHQNPSILESFCHDTYNLYLVHYTLTTCPQHANINYLPYASHYNPRFVYFLPHFRKPKTFFQGVFFVKF